MDAYMGDIPNAWDSARRSNRIKRIIRAEDAAWNSLCDVDFSAALVLEQFKLERTCSRQAMLSRMIDRRIDKLDDFIADIDRRVAKIHG